MEHLLHNAHGEWALFAALMPAWFFLRGVIRGFWRSFKSGIEGALPGYRYRVLQERVAYGEVEHRIHGPYRSYIWASLVAICIVLGREYDSATVQERK